MKTAGLTDSRDAAEGLTGERPKKPMIEYYPTVLQLYITDRCNYECTFCVARQADYRDGRVTQYREMGTDVLDRLSEAIHNADHVYLTGGGEPLMSPLFWEFIEGRRPVKGVYFNTNGSLLHKKNIERILSFPGQMNFGISMNACSRKTYRRLMGVDLFDKVKDNIMQLVQRKRDLGKSIQIDLSMVVVRENLDEMVSLCDFAREVGADRVVAHIGEFSQVYERGWFSVSEQSLRHNHALMEIFEKNLMAMDQRSRELGLLSWSRDGSNELWDNTCNDIFSYMGVTAEGNTFSCCKGCAVPTGNVHEYGNFMALWNNDKRQNMRRDIIEGRFPRECRKPICPYWRVQKQKAETSNDEGEKLFHKGDRGGAVQAFRTALKHNPHSATPHNNLGVIYWHGGEYQKAMQHFLNAYRIDRFDRDTNINLVNILLTLDRKDDAREIMMAYLSHSPDDEEMNMLALRIMHSQGVTG
jgi:molybdenum cofactor biosynthesis enzyme MoaA